MPVIWMVSVNGPALYGGWQQRRRHLLVLRRGTLDAFSVGAESEFKYFYVCFCPSWGPHGRVAGALLIAAVIQSGIIVIVNLLGFSAISVLEVQMLTVVLAILGFFVGVVVDEQRRVSSELRQTLRLAAAGEMAGALAHELNQPLTALSAYATACDKLLQQGDTGDRLRDAVRRIVSESERAGEVIRRLRDFFRTGTTQLESVVLGDLLTPSVASFSGRAEKQASTLPWPRCPTVFCSPTAFNLRS